MHRNLTAVANTTHIGFIQLMELGTKIELGLLEPGELNECARELARFTKFVVGTSALTPTIFHEAGYFDIFDKDSNVIHRHEAAQCICRRNIYHTMMVNGQLNNDGQPVITRSMFEALPRTMRCALGKLCIEDNVTHYRQPLCSGDDIIHLLMHNLGHEEGMTFENYCATWYRDLLIEEHDSDDIGLHNGILRAWGYVEKGETMESIKNNYNNNLTTPESSDGAD